MSPFELRRRIGHRQRPGERAALIIVFKLADDLPIRRHAARSQPPDGFGLAHEAPQAMHRVDQTLVAKQHDRLPRRPTRNPVLRRQLMLTRQQTTRRIDPVADRRAQPISDLLIDRPIRPRINHPSHRLASLAIAHVDNPQTSAQPCYADRRLWVTFRSDLM